MAGEIMISNEITTMYDYAVVVSRLNGSAWLELLSQEDFGNFFGREVVFSSNSKEECLAYIAKHNEYEYKYEQE